MGNKQTIPRAVLIVGANRGIGYYMVKTPARTWQFSFSFRY